MGVSFSLSIDDLKKIDNWLHNVVFPSIVEEQKKNPDIAPLLFEDSNGVTHPYEGPNGGVLTYCFTPTSLGIIVKVTYREHELNLTNWENW
jgi:hypothetical protein